LGKKRPKLNKIKSPNPWPASAIIASAEHGCSLLFFDFALVALLVVVVAEHEENCWRSVSSAFRPPRSIRYDFFSDAFKKGLPFLSFLSFFATWQKERRERKMTIYYARVCLLHANAFNELFRAMMMMVMRWCVVRFAFLCSSFRIISSSSSHHHVCCVGCVGRVFFYTWKFTLIGFVLCCSLSGAHYMFTFSVFATFSPSNVTWEYPEDLWRPGHQTFSRD